MNKLVSRNPVLRFKEGKKIIKAQFGRNIILIDSKNDIWQDKSTGKKYLRNWRGRRWNRTPQGTSSNDFSNYFLEYSPSIPQLRIGMNGKPIVDTISQLNTNNKNSAPVVKPVQTIPSNKYAGSSVRDYSQLPKKTTDVVNKTPLVKTVTPVDNYYLKGFEKRKDEIAKLGGVRAVLKMLGFTEGNGLDGKWGQNTEDAYLEYLKSQSPNNIKYTPGIQNNEGFIPTGETTTNFNVAKEYLTPKQETTTFNLGTYVGDPTRTYNAGNIRANRGNLYSNVNEYWDYLSNNKNSDDFQLFLNIMGTLDGNLNRDAFDAAMAKYGISGNLGRRDSGRLANLLNDLRAIGTEGSDARNAFLNSYKLSFDNVQTGVGNTIYDRSATREWLRNNAGGSAYAFTGDLRKAVRNILNGLGTDQDKELIKGNADLTKALTGYFKTGGNMNILPSRNIIERFKLGRKLLFAKPGDKMLYNGKEQVTEEVLNGQTIYRRKNGTYVYENNKNLSPLKSTPKTAPKPKVAPKVDLGSTEVNRFAIASRKGTRYFDSAEKAKAYLKTLPSGSAVFRDMGEEWKGLVVKADRTQGKDAVSTSYGRKQAEKYNNLSYKDAYKAAQSSGNKYFAYKGKVYKTDLKNGKDNQTEMLGLYGTHLGWGENPKLQNTLSRAARELYRKDTKASNTNRNANYNGKTNKLVSAEADKKVALTWNEKQFMDLMTPTPANMINYGIDIITGNLPNKPHVSGLNVPGLFTDAVEGNYKDAGYRALDLGLSFAPGARVNMTPGGTNVTKGATLLPNGTRTFSKWQLNSLGKNATRPMEGVLRSPKGTLYYIDNGQFTKDITAPLLISNVPVQRTYDLEK